MQNPGFCGIVALIAGVFLLSGFTFIVYIIVRAVYKSRKQIEMMRTSRPISLDQLKQEAGAMVNEARYLELYGRAECFFPIKTPFSKLKAICYELKVEQIWHEPGYEKEAKVMKMEEYFMCAPFQLTDNTNTIEMKINSHMNLNMATVNSVIFDKPQEIDVVDTYSTVDWETGKSAEFNSGTYWDDYDREYGFTQKAENVRKVPEKNRNPKKTGYRYTETYILPGTELNMTGYLTFRDGRFFLKSGNELCYVSDKPKEVIVLGLDSDRSRNIGCLVLIAAVVILTFFLFAGITQWFWETGIVVFNLIFLVLAYMALSSLVILTHFEVFWEDLRKVGSYVSDYFIT